MTITHYKMTEEGEEMQVNTWREASHCIIDIDARELAEDSLAAGVWIGQNKRTIADYALHEPYSDAPYIEVYKKRA